MRDIRPYAAAARTVKLGHMVTHEMSRRVLQAIADCYPDAGTGVIRAIDISQEKDDEPVQVDIVHESQVLAGESFAPVQLDHLRTAVCHALEPWRHAVRTIELVP